MTPPRAVKAASNGAGKTNLDALRQARREATGVAPVVVLGGTDYTLPVALPAAVLVGIGDVQAGRLSGLRDAISALFGDGNVEAVLAAGFEIDDFNALLDLYDDAGFSPASGGSS